MIEKELQPWEKTESQACNILGMEHVGGSGNPDCVDKEKSNLIAEVKDYSRNLNVHDYNTIKKKPWAKGKKLIIVAKNGCSKNAIEEANKDSDVVLLCGCGVVLEEENSLNHVKRDLLDNIPVKSGSIKDLKSTSDNLNL